MTLLVIDPGTRIMGWAIFKNGTLQDSGTITAKGNDLGKRLFTHYSGICGLLAGKPDVLLHEEGMVHRSRDGARSLGAALGVVLLAAAERTIKVKSINVSTWKKAFTGTGSASKEQVHAAVDAVCPGLLSEAQDKDGNFLDQDRADAIAIGMGFLATADVK